MHTSDYKKQQNKSQSVANSVSQKKEDTNNAFQFVDNRPKAIIQQKIIATTQTEALKNANDITQLQVNKTVQLGKKRKKKDSDDDSDGGEWKPPAERRKHRHTFSKALRRRVITKAPRNKSGNYVCPGCGRPLADRKGREIKTYYTSKSGKRHKIVSGQLDHFPKWSTRLARLKRLKKSASAIRADHDDPTRLRPLCRRCNQSHKFEKTKKLPDSGFSDDEYFSDDEARDDEIWKKHRKHDDDDNSGAGAGAGISV
ncbi:hypothetical protein [uncultured Kordia sp.]|uniref:hypothetical protein n=1 Tax=uncultured Kordia sp. TaxID=507699 RepID=UPI002627E0ED|nr:hypothetical protein [uncultured Kordia sp.]